MLLACFGGREKDNQFQNDVMDGGLLGLTPNLNPGPSGDKIEPADFNNAFWGLKFHGYEVLHNSLKHAPAATRELSEFIREVALAHDNYAKALCRLGKQEKSNSPHILISPIWKIVKSFVEKSGAAHMELSKKLFDLSSEIRVYADKDLKERHRPHKKQFHQTAEATDKIQHIAQNLTKQRENRARLESSSGSGQKFEKRIEKSNDDLKKNVDAFNNALNIYEPNFIETTNTFTDLETGHIDKLALYLRNVQTAYESCNVMNRSINEAFEKGIKDDATPEYVITQFAKHRGTGTQRPKIEHVEEAQNPTPQNENVKIVKKSSLSPSRQRLNPSSSSKSPKRSTSHNSSKESINDTSTSTNSEQTTNETKVPQSGTSRPAPVPPPPIKSVLKSDMDSDSDSDVPKEKLEKLKITPKSDHDEKDKKVTKKKSQNDEEEVDSEGYTVRRHRKSSSSSSSSWSSDDDGKPSHEKTYKIKVKIKDLDEVKPAQNQELVKLSGPDLSAPVRSKPRPGRKAVPSPIPAPLIPSPTSTEPSVIEKPPPAEPQSNLTEVSLADLTLDISTKEETRESSPADSTPTNQTSTPLSQKTSKPPPPIPPNPNKPNRNPKSEQIEHRPATNSSTSLQLDNSFKRPLSPIMTGEPRPITPLITGGSLIGEISWSNAQNAKGAPLASVESLSPTSSTGSPYCGVEIPVRVAVTETLNAKFLGVGDENTQIATNAEIYLDFATSAIKYLNDSHNQLNINLTGAVDSIRVNPTFSTLHQSNDQNLVQFDANNLKSSLNKMINNKPDEHHFMLKVASYRVIDTPMNLPLLLLSYWKKEGDDFRVRVVAKASSTIYNLRILSKAKFEDCQSDPPHSIEDGRLTFIFDEIKAGKEKIISAVLKNCPSSSPFAAQFLIDGRSSSSVECPAGSSFKISYLRRRVKTGVFISEPIY